MNYLLYNRLANGGKGEEEAKIALEFLNTKIGDIKEISVVDVDVIDFLNNASESDLLILLGGDGTLNNFVNRLGDLKLDIPVYLYPAGTGNDFLNDVKSAQDPNTHLVKLNDYINHLPKVFVNGRTYRFVNGIGFGIDGDCCVVAENKKAAGETSIDYGKITVDLLLHSYVPRGAKVKVDGVEFNIKKAYLASAMNGKYYGGGMMIAPSQDRASGLLTFVSIHGRGKLGTLLMFPKLFKGTHVKDKKHCFIKQGREIEVTFDRPCGLQIDGDVVNDVTTYKAWIA
jgi:diacylglycerol kinase family enzyme